MSFPTEDFPMYAGELPYLTTAQMIEVDRLMIAEYKIELIQMMENAGRNLARLARGRFLDHDPRGKSVTVLAGSGSNGGGALVCARHLHIAGAQVQVLLSRPPADWAGVPAHQLQILQRIGLPVQAGEPGPETPPSDLLIDGLIGYSLKGAPRGKTADLIRWANRQAAPVLALDTPSGLDTTSGVCYEPAIRAAATLTLALPKSGLRAGSARQCVGELYLADISVPPELFARPGLDLQVPPLFAQSEVLRLW
jgi:NAD(P)H-hydrate epimerase